MSNEFLLTILMALAAAFAVLSIRRGASPRRSASNGWYDRAASAIVGLLLLALLIYAVLALPDAL